MISCLLKKAQSIVAMLCHIAILQQT